MSFDNQGKPYYYSAAEVDQTTKADAKRYQAVFAARLNYSTGETKRLEEELSRHFKDPSNAFYGNFLGPALKFRKEISSKIGLKKKGNSIIKDAFDASLVIDNNMETLLADLMTRNKLYDSRMNLLLEKVGQNDAFASAINSLSAKGTTASKHFTGNIVNHDAEDQYKKLYTTYSESSPNIFQSSHSGLANLTSDDHPQYLKKAGDTITGDISVAAGKKIDGVDVGSHAHTSTDGSVQLSGADLAAGSLTDSTIDTSDKPTAISSLTSTTGVDSNEVILSWDGDDENYYEVQIATLERDSLGGLTTFALDDLSDVDAPSPSDGQVLLSWIEPSDNGVLSDPRDRLPIRSAGWRAWRTTPR